MTDPNEPSPRRRALLALGVAVGAGLGIFALLADKGRKPPPLSPTLEHRAAHGGNDRAACLACHQAGAARKRPPGHTGRQDCWSCHDMAPRTGGSTAPGR